MGAVNGRETEIFSDSAPPFYFFSCAITAVHRAGWLGSVITGSNPMDRYSRIAGSRSSSVDSTVDR